MAINWSKGYSCTWRIYVVSPDTWADDAIIGGLESAEVERSYEGDAPLIESGSFDVTYPIGEAWNEKYLRLVMVAEQDGIRERVEVCTLLCASASGEIDKGADKIKITGRSVLYPASVASVKIGAFAPAGSNGVEEAANLLREVIGAPVETQGSFKLSSHVIYDTGQTVLSAVWTLLDAGGFGIRILGNGTVRIAKLPTSPVMTLNQTNVRLMHTGVGHELDWSTVPNRYIAVEGGKVSIATNDNLKSPTSIPVRGYRHDIVDTSPVRVRGETLEAYCSRKLEENSVVFDNRSWSREWWPDVVPGDIIRVSLRAYDIEGDFRIIRQSLKCEHGIVVDEQVRKEVYSWQRT